jgi:hypothetical protein
MLCRECLRRRGLFRGEDQIRPNEGQFLARIPSLLGQSIEHAANRGTDHPAGSPAGFEHFAEDDFFEYDLSWAPTVAYGTGIHDWYGIYSSVCQYGYRKGSSGFCDITNAGAGTPYDNFVSTKPSNAAIDWTQWHTIGQLWVPGNAGNYYQGYVQNFIDGVPANAGTGAFSPLSKTGWTHGTIDLTNLQNSPEAFSIIDQDHLMVILGAGVGQTLNVAYVHVWQPAGCGARHQQGQQTDGLSIGRFGGGFCRESGSWFRDTP